MKLCDVNVLVYASREELPQHAKCKRLLEEMRTSSNPFAVADIVLAGFVRLVCHRKTFKTPTPIASALAFTKLLRSSHNAVPIAPGVKHWDIFSELMVNSRIPGDECWDAYVAAMAIESNCQWMSFDRGFARFPSLNWIDLNSA